MSRGIARIGDRTLGTCYHDSHISPVSDMGGTIITGSPNMQDQSKPIARLDDLVETDCGHIDAINSSSGTITNDAGLTKKVARLSDTVGRDGVYEASIITASTVTFGDP